MEEVVAGVAIKAEDMMWGHNLGCDFAKQSCLSWMKRNLENPYPFCNIYGDVSLVVIRSADKEASLKSASDNSIECFDKTHNTSRLHLTEVKGKKSSVAAKCKDRELNIADRRLAAKKV
ncbi:hypothetical protein OSTOST_16587, partial [Ostertagia ostertagi]